MSRILTPYKTTKYIFSLLGLMLFTFVLSGCSSGGGDDGDPDTEPTVPDELNYEIRQGEGISLSVMQGGRQASISAASLFGTYDRTSEAFTLSTSGPPVMAVKAGVFLAALDAELSSEIGEAVNFSNYYLSVTAAAAWVGSGDLTSGELAIRDGDSEYRNITLQYNPDVDAGMDGMDITYWPLGLAGASQTVSVTWHELDGLFEDESAAAYARIASFAYSVLRFMYEQADLVVGTLQYIADVDTVLEQQGTVEESCDTYQLPVLPALPEPTPGMSTFTWVDTNLDGEIGGSDDFSWNFNQCWNDEETDDIDIIFDGGLDLVNYVEVENADVITRIGFEPYIESSGGVVYDNLKLTETETTLGNVIIHSDEAMTLTGGFSMVFTSP